ncbi:hypothetical protein HDV05_006748 [Chytridiales sp. JEL 0842]|nr:hypothetical protein HDV05_006748 [Chytridiales sp. JEL 0842]
MSNSQWNDPSVTAASEYLQSNGLSSESARPPSQHFQPQPHSAAQRDHIYYNQKQSHMSWPQATAPPSPQRYPSSNNASPSRANGGIQSNYQITPPTPAPSPQRTSTLYPTQRDLHASSSSTLSISSQHPPTPPPKRSTSMDQLSINTNNPLHHVALAKAERKLQRILNANAKLAQSLERSRIPVSEAASSLVRFCYETADPLVPSSGAGGYKEVNPFVARKEKEGCCSIF